MRLYDMPRGVAAEPRRTPHRRWVFVAAGRKVTLGGFVLPVPGEGQALDREQLLHKSPAPKHSSTRRRADAWSQTAATTA